MIEVEGCEEPEPRGEQTQRRKKVDRMLMMIESIIHSFVRSFEHSSSYGSFIYRVLHMFLDMPLPTVLRTLIRYQVLQDVNNRQKNKMISSESENEKSTNIKTSPTNTEEKELVYLPTYHTSTSMI